LHQLPIIFLVQDNNWGISVTAEEARSQDAYDFIAGFKGIERMRIDGTEFPESYLAMKNAFDYVRTERKPILVCAKTVLIGHHTSGVRKEMYRPWTIWLNMKLMIREKTMEIPFGKWYQ
jgi:2-oxoisovalerate dehydrogenase E1 component